MFKIENEGLFLMKKLLCASVMALFSMSAYSADLVGLIHPDNLGLNLVETSQKYALKIQRLSHDDIDKNHITYQVDGLTDSQKNCFVSVETNQDGDIQKIHFSHYGEGCDVQIASPLQIDLDKTTVTDIIKQTNQPEYNVYPTDTSITPVCFDCPASGNVGDVLTVANVKDDFKLQFEVLGDNPDFQKEIAIKYLKLKKYNPDKHYDYMKRLDKLFAKNPSLLQHADFQKIAMQYYRDAEVFSYTINVK